MEEKIAKAVTEAAENICNLLDASTAYKGTAKFAALELELTRLLYTVQVAANQQRLGELRP